MNSSFIVKVNTASFLMNTLFTFPNLKEETI